MEVRNHTINEELGPFSELVRQMNFLAQDFGVLQRQLPGKDEKGFVHTILCSLGKINAALPRAHASLGEAFHAMRETV